MKKTSFWILTILGFLLLLEVLLRIAGIGRSYSESTGGKFITYYDKHLPTWYHTWSPNYPIIYDQPEIKCSYPANSLGLREIELPANRPDSVKRLMVIGDSFVEGDGVEYPYSMPRYLEKKLDSAQLHYQVYNAGSSGSDPFYEYTLLRDKLMPMHPTHVIMVINSSDIIDFIFRGGMERFQKDGTTLYKKSNWLLPFYAHSYIVRLLMHYRQFSDETLLDPDEKKIVTQQAVAQIYQCLAKTKQLCDSANVKFAVMLQPCPSDLANNDHYQSCIHAIANMDQTTVNLIDLYPDFIKVINANNYLDYSWKINGHFNAKGYQLFADILYSNINSRYPDFWQ